MKKLFSCLFIFSQCVSAQHLFQKIYGNQLDDWFESIEIVNDTELFAIGYTRENDLMNNTILFVALNDSGNIKWSNSINIGYDDIPKRIIKLTNNDLLLTGYTLDYVPPGDYDMMLICFDLSGNILWKKNWGTNKSELLLNSIESSNNYIYSTGYIDFNFLDSSAVKLTKTDVNGNILWDKSYITSYSTFGNDIQETNAGCYLISGAVSASSSSDYDMLLMKTDSAGNPLWAKGYGGASDEYSGYIVNTNDSGILVAATSFSFNNPPGNGDILIIRTDSSGSVIWSKKYGDAGHEQIKGMIRDSSGNYIIWGSSTSYPLFTGGLVFKIDEHGDVLWSRLYGKGNLTVLLSVKQIHDQFLIAGQIHSPLPPSNRDGYLVRTGWLGESGCNDTIVSISYSDVLINTYNVLMTDTIISFTENLSYSDTALNVQTNVLCDSVVSVDEHNSGQFINILPNPNTGIFFIETMASERIKAIEIYNMLGQKLSFNATYLDNVIEISLKDKVDGLCLIKIIRENKNYFFKIIIL